MLNVHKLNAADNTYELMKLKDLQSIHEHIYISWG